MDPIKIIEKYYDKDSELYRVLITHSKLVTEKALEIAKRVPELKPDLKFIEEAAMLHDIGIIGVVDQKPKLDLKKDVPYLKHIIFGKEILEKEGLPKHAHVAENHSGTKISKEEIKKRNLQLPLKDYVPETIEEEIISFADLFYSKSPGDLEREKSIEEIRQQMAKFGKEHAKKFKEWLIKFKEI